MFDFSQEIHSGTGSIHSGTGSAHSGTGSAPKGVPVPDNDISTQRHRVTELIIFLFSLYLCISVLEYINISGLAMRELARDNRS